MRRLMTGIATAAVLLAAVPAPLATADPVDDAIDLVRFALCPAPEVDLCTGEASCPLLATLAPGVPGVADIAPDGDVHVDGRLVRDCPPYGV